MGPSTPTRTRGYRPPPHQGWLAAGMLRGAEHGGTDGGTVARSVGSPRRSMLRFGKPMPYRFDESRRHKFPTARYRVTNWPDYDAALVRRGELTVWLTEEAIASWYAPATGERGGQPIYSAIAIETALTLRLVFHQPLRQTEGLLRSIAALLDIDIAIPDHTTLSRRGGGLNVLPESIGHGEPLHLLIDSTARARANGWITSVAFVPLGVGAKCISVSMPPRMKSSPLN